MLLRCKAFLLVFLLIMLTSFPVYAEDNLYNLTDEAFYEVNTIYHINNNGASSSQKINLEILLINEHLARNCPYSQLLYSNYSLPMRNEYQDDKGNKTGSFFIKELLPGEKKDIKITQLYRVALINYEVNPAAVGEYTQYSNILLPYLLPSPGIECQNEAIIKKATEITAGESNPYLKAKKIFAFMQSHMHYADEISEYTNLGAVWALETGVGVCEDYADLMVALLRASEVPARTVSGWMGEVASELVVSDSTGVVKKPGHMWVEYYLTNYGWIPADPTYVFLLNGVSTVDYTRLTGTKELRYIEDSETQQPAVYYSYYGGDISVTKEISIVRNPKILYGSSWESILFYIDDIPLVFDVEPVIYEDRTLVPLRGIATALGAQVNWEETNQEITILSNNKTIKLQIGSSIAYLDGQEIILDTSAKIVQNRTMVPLRFIGESLGVSVNWNGAERIIKLNNS